MKTSSLLIIISLGLPSILNAQTTSVAKEDNRPYYTKQFYLPGKVQSITVKTATGEHLASIEVPENVLLSIYSTDQDRVPALRTEFHGKISVRTKPYIKTQNHIGGVELMADAPFRIDLADAIVSVTTTTKK
jgi:hypothetical protein